MLVDELHIAGVGIDRQLVWIVLPEDTLVRLQTRDAAVDGDTLGTVGLSLMMVAPADLLMLPFSAIGEQHGHIAGVVAPFAQYTVDNTVDVGRYQSLEEGVLIVQPQDNVTAALCADVACDLHGTRVRGSNDLAVFELGIDRYRTT